MEKVNVLIVEDDTKISEIHRMFTEKLEQFHVSGIANTLDDAEQMISILEPDLILLDLYFPEGNGMDLLRKTRAKNYQVDVILITAAKEINSLQEALHSGVFDYIVKPVVFDRFKQSMLRYQEHLQKLKASSHLEQQDIDSYFHTDSAQHELPHNIPKGIDSLTLKKIKDVFIVEEVGGLSAEQVGEKVGASRSTARRYLEYLISLNILYADQDYGTVGRPERKYLLNK